MALNQSTIFKPMALGIIHFRTSPFGGVAHCYRGSSMSNISSKIGIDPVKKERLHQ